MRGGGIEKTSYIFQESLAVLAAYCDYQKEVGIDIPEINDRVNKLVSNNSINRVDGGYQIISRQSLLKGVSVDFPTLIDSRHSMRTYSQEPISRDQIISAVDLAKKAPSACNRQPWKFYFSMRPEINKQIMDAVPKQSFLAAIPYFGVITIDKKMFSLEEAFQGFINGGIFAAYLQLSLHSIGIGSCLFQFPYLQDGRMKLRNETGIPDNEEIIAIIGYGRYPEEAKCIKAYRKASESIAVEI